jgi:CubicO group peptidase (beta-lactamase class C family)
MTGVVLQRLIEEKKIAPEDRLSKFIPDFPNGDKITIQLLRSHRSGIPHRVMRPEEESLGYTSAEFVERVKAAKLAFEPGAQRLYSSAGYAVLARALEIASGKPYAQLLREYVFAPAGMTDSLDFDGETIMERRSQDYLLEAGGVVNAPLKDYSFLVGAGSVYSTARDVYKFGEAVLDGKYGAASVASFVRDNEISANGSTNGHRAYFKINRAKKWGFVFVSNLNSGANDMIQAAVESILDGKPVAPPAAPAPKIVANPNKNLSEFLGQYVREGGGSFEVNVRNGVLRAGEIKLYPTGADRFFEYRYYGDVTFVRDAAGRVKEIKWASPGFVSTWVRQ